MKHRLRRVPERLTARLGEAERGAVLILIASMLTVFMGMAAFAIDFGWLYWNGIKIQHGADAAALAGVIYEPEDQAQAYAQAIESASENGFAGGGTTVVPVDFNTDPTAVENANQLRVTITHPVPTFFMKVFGIQTIDIKKTAVAEYVLPLPLGSPDRRFGNDPTKAGSQPEFWGNIHGYFTGRGMGDRYASQCVSWDSGSGCTKNPDRRQTNYSTPTVGGYSANTGGYLYGIEVSGGATSLNVEVFDGPFTRGGGDLILTGDNPQGSSPGPTTVFTLYAPDPTPLDTSNNEVLCNVVFPPRDAYYPGATASTTWADVDAYLPGGLDDLWDSVCPSAISGYGDGVYPLRVLTLDNGERGLNRWSLRASTSGTQPRIFGLGDMSIFSNVDGASGDTIFYLAEVQPIHAGKDLVVSLWDPGDASGNHSMRVKAPDGSLPGCTWTSTNPAYPGGTLASCDIATSGARFNDYLVEVRIHLPDDYTCAADCWWKIDYNYPGQTQDTTTWSARIEGNPVKLVE